MSLKVIKKVKLKNVKIEHENKKIIINENLIRHCTMTYIQNYSRLSLSQTPKDWKFQFEITVV